MAGGSSGRRQWPPRSNKAICKVVNKQIDTLKFDYPIKLISCSNVGLQVLNELVRANSTRGQLKAIDETESYCTNKRTRSSGSSVSSASKVTRRLRSEKCGEGQHDAVESKAPARIRQRMYTSVTSTQTGGLCRFYTNKHQRAIVTLTERVKRLCNLMPIDCLRAKDRIRPGQGNVYRRYN